MAQRTVDIHNHYYPIDYIKHLLSRTGKTKAVQTGPQSYVMKASDVIVAHIDRPGHYDLAARIADLDKAGMDTQIVSKTIPGPDMLERDEGVYWAKRINDALAEATQKYPHRLYAYACLPYQDVDEFLQGTDALPEGAWISRESRCSPTSRENRCFSRSSRRYSRWLPTTTCRSLCTPPCR